jgi:translation elongation factor aEF-1 beta
VPEVLKALQVRQLRVRGTIGEIATGSYVIRLKVLPQDTTTEHQKIVDSVSGALPSPAKVRAHRIEPIAFGLSAIIMDIVAPEEEGMIEKIEAAVSSAPLVGQSDMMGVSRMSSKLPT